MKAIARAVLLLAALFLSACSIHKPIEAERGVESTEARELAAALIARNHTLSSFKGTGRFKLWQGEKVLSTRAAWVGSYPDKLRIAVMNPVGQPLASLSTDGQYLYMISHSEGEFYKKQSSNPTLQRLISIPISTRDIISILTARLPIREYDSAKITTDKSGRGYVLTLAKKWQGITEKIYLDTDKRSVLQVEIFGAADELSYRTVFHGSQMVNEFELPDRIVIADAAENYFELDIDQYWVDVPLLPSIFVLSPP